VIYSFLVGGVGLFGSSDASAGGSAATVTGAMVLADETGAIFFNAADSGRHVAPGLFVVAGAQTPITLETFNAIADLTGGLFVVSSNGKAHVLPGIFLET
jgi:hypothetical protein